MDENNNREEFITERKKAKFFFNLVAFIYPFIETHLFPEYRRAVKKLNLPNDYSVLDLATGTGILAAAFNEVGHRVKGLDFSKKLLKRARKRFEGVEFEIFDLIKISEVKSELYDIVSTGYLLHGLSPDFRNYILKNMVRISKKYVIVFDYCCDGGWFVRFIEWLEGSDYMNFISVSREKEFADAGLKIERAFMTSKIGNVWLCSKI
jgi:SAM-dependent methyltransferase